MGPIVVVVLRDNGVAVVVRHAAGCVTEKVFFPLKCGVASGWIMEFFRWRMRFPERRFSS